MRTPRFTYANVTATLAVFLALGGTSYAVTALPRNSVGSKQVRDRSLQRNDLARSVTFDIARGPRGSEGPTGPQGIPGPQGSRGPADVWIAKQRPSLTLPTTANTPLEVRRIPNLPAGSWDLRFSADAVSTFGGEAIVQCTIAINGDPRAHGGAVVGQAAPAVQQVGIQVESAATSSTPFTPVVTCYQNQPNSPSPVIDGAQLIATQSADVTVVP
jgi:hypothetical protein